MEPIAILLVIVTSLVSGFVIGKFQERRDWNVMMAKKNMTPEHWKNIPYQHGG